MQVTEPTILTVGHSNHSIDHLLDLLQRHSVTAVADVRSVPASRFTPHFNREPLHRALSEHGIAYVFLGPELGARPADRSCYVGGKVQFERLAASPPFAAGIERLLAGMRRQRIALLCAEQDPLDCHRTVLVSHELSMRGVAIDHIHSDGRLETHRAAMERLLAAHNLTDPDLFGSDRLGEALRKQEALIAFEEDSEPMNQAQR